MGRRGAGPVRIWARRGAGQARPSGACCYCSAQRWGDEEAARGSAGRGPLLVDLGDAGGDGLGDAGKRI